MTDIPLVPHPLTYPNKDSAKRLVGDGGLKFNRPWIAAGGQKFTWPVGTEGFRISGQALVALHRYIGDNTARANVIHFNEGRIEMTGTLPGLTSPLNMVNLEDVLMSRNKKTLALPGILPKIQYVVIESYDFPHDENDRTSSIAYTIAMIRVGNTGSAAQSGGSQSSLDAFQTASGSPSVANRAPNSQSPRTFATVQGIDTFRAVSDRVYGDVNQWPKLVDLNKDSLIKNNPALINISPYQLPYYRWPVGTRLVY